MYKFEKYVIIHRVKEVCMILKGDIKKIDEFKYMIPKGTIPCMRVPGIFYADDVLLEKALEDNALIQLANVACLPGIEKYSIAMPDIHWGYGFPIGGVAATNPEKGGIISPGGVGFDVNCGIRVLRTNLTREDITGEKLKELIYNLFSEIPSGLGKKGKIRLSKSELKKVIKDGAKWAVYNGYGDEEDLEYMEEKGCMEGADPEKISKRALERGAPQLGTLGSGNHFLEIQYVSKIFSEPEARVLGLFPGQITVMIHTGSRGFGHEVCSDYLDVMQSASYKYGIELPDRQLASVPFESPEGRAYFSAMAGASNFAWANREIITHWVRDVFYRVLRMGPKDLGMSLIYDVAHNIAKKEIHTIDGKEAMLIVHRKGATRAFPPGHRDIPYAYRSIGQPVLIPGDMGRSSYILVGTKKAMEETFGSACHGAGRVMSRNKAKKAAKGRDITEELRNKGILVKSLSKATLSEEMSDAYKDVNEVVNIVDVSGIAKKVAKLKPIGVMKG